ncbi:MAG: ABC transporter permease [Acidimicrobiia bacterium]|nr:ABC transporter permease [Acidimicrobiia bacterium]
MAFILKKVLQLVVVLLVVSFASFVLLDLLPGDSVTVRCGIGCTVEQQEQLREELGLDQIVPIQYAKWLQQVVIHQDLGQSAVTREPVTEALGNRLPVTLVLVIMSQVLALGIGLPLGMASARKPGGTLDRISTGIAAIGISVPNYVFAIVLIAVFALGFGLFPVLYPASANPAEQFWALILPAICLAMAELAVYMRLLRNDLISTLQEDYITMAKAKGLSSGYIMRRHAFRPSTFSLITVAGINMGRLIGGTIVIEVAFGIAGMGSYVLEAIFRRDGVPLQGALLVIAAGYVLINFAVDMLYAVLDPRIRHARAVA